MHDPPLQALTHAVPFCQVPVASHVCGTFPLQPFVPGVHTPVHAPATHAWFVHAAAVPHCPDALQVWTPLPEHCFAPGVQMPTHVPP